MKQTLVSFDEKHETLLDYFAIIGFDNGQLRKVIAELNEGENQKGEDYPLEKGESRASQLSESTGLFRLLKPSVLERFPQIDRHKLDFPTYI